MVPLPAVPTVPAVPAVPAAAESLATPATAMQLEALAKMVRVVGRPVTTEGLTRGQASTLLKELIDEANTRSAQRRGDAVVTPVASPAPPVALAPPAESRPAASYDAAGLCTLWGISLAPCLPLCGRKAGLPLDVGVVILLL